MHTCTHDWKDRDWILGSRDRPPLSRVSKYTNAIAWDAYLSSCGRGCLQSWNGKFLHDNSHLIIWADLRLLAPTPLPRFAQERSHAPAARDTCTRWNIIRSRFQALPRQGRMGRHVPNPPTLHLKTKAAYVHGPHTALFHRQSYLIFNGMSAVPSIS